MKKIFRKDCESSIIGSLKDSVLEILHECSNEGWDCYNAEAILSKVVHETFKFIELLPVDVTMPEVIPEPSGDVGLLWQKSNSQLLSLAISAEGVLSYAFIFGKNEGCGHLQFFDELPEMISKLLRMF